MTEIQHLSAQVTLSNKGLIHTDTLITLSKDLKVSDVLPTQESEIVTRLERHLGDTEASYFLPSRESGVNDMYLHLGCHGPIALVERPRICLIWAVLRLRHPLLASKIEMRDYNDIKFIYDTPQSVEAVLADADANLEQSTKNGQGLIESYLNGPRTLSTERLSYLMFSQTPLGDSSVLGNTTQNYDFLICATHFLGDGMALHQFANDLFGLLGGSLTNGELSALLESEWVLRCVTKLAALPASMEERFPPLTTSRFRHAAHAVDFDLNQRKLIGGHAFPRTSQLPRSTIVPTVSFDPERTTKMLRNCKARGVSISSALFAICNVAWARTHSKDWELPMMMYSALNMRSYLAANKSLNDSYWFLAIGYFNIVLPSFLPRNAAEIPSTFWHRARSAKTQSTNAVKSAMIIPRAREMSRKRGEQARRWAKEDDDRAAGVFTKSAPVASVPQSFKVPPSKALIGLSLLGNLDGIYKHSSFPNIQLHTLTTGSRQRSGGMLLFGYTFVGKLWVSLGYDQNGFEKDTIERYWSNVLAAIDELLVA
ncbi:hypothetical protein BDQ12DRAFT_736718 [Crucibulum laeve]|uniref:Alcohol acetyltransferase n=1 Tax=Crucibulum laeve TaxID=68775 RepID=A0A5C3LV72_9AGAR|nr:hypothetical protein BDQ12DRAFT_736718 [Crucibulum laeve]